MDPLLSKFITHVNSHEDWLMDRILSYAKERNYTKYTSTLKEAWRLSISGLSKSLTELIQAKEFHVELGPDENYTSDPATQFGIIEAKRHMERGIRLDMFLGLMKYYHQSYQDLIEDSGFNIEEKKRIGILTQRFFDRVEISFCATWAASEQQDVVLELQDRNRQITNEKNKYLTIYESLSMPVFIVNPSGIIENMNHAASQMFDSNSLPGAEYYKETREGRIFTKEFQWLAESYQGFIESEKSIVISEKFLANEELYFHISFCRSLDISGKFLGSIIIIEDITTRKQAENEKEKLIKELSAAIEEIKTLKGIIPICMHCKEIRDDKGYWIQLEKFISERSEAEFSHSICEKCLEKHYPEESSLMQQDK